MTDSSILKLCKEALSARAGKKDAIALKRFLFRIKATARSNLAFINAFKNPRFTGAGACSNSCFSDNKVSTFLIWAETVSERIRPASCTQ